MSGLKNVRSGCYTATLHSTASRKTSGPSAKRLDKGTGRSWTTNQESLSLRTPCAENCVHKDTAFHYDHSYLCYEEQGTPINIRKWLTSHSRLHLGNRRLHGMCIKRQLNQLGLSFILAFGGCSSGLGMWTRTLINCAAEAKRTEKNKKARRIITPRASAILFSVCKQEWSLAWDKLFRSHFTFYWSITVVVFPVFLVVCIICCVSLYPINVLNK